VRISCISPLAHRLVALCDGHGNSEVPIDARRGDALEGYEKKENIDAKYTTQIQ